MRVRNSNSEQFGDILVFHMVFVAVFPSFFKMSLSKFLSVKKNASEMHESITTIKATKAKN